MHFKFSLQCFIVVDIAISSTIEILKQRWFLLARKDSQIENFSANWQNSIQIKKIGNTVSGGREENATVNEGTGNQDFTVGTSDNNLMSIENTVNVKTLESCSN